MASSMRGNAKINNPIESRQWTEETLQTLRFLVGIGHPLLLFFVILVIVFNVLPNYFPPTSIFEAPLLLLVMNTLFVSIIPFVVALIALRGYIEGGSANLLFFGCGMLSFTLACFIAGWLGAQAQANANLTIHNTGVLLASLFNLLAGVTLYLGKSAEKDGEKYKKNVGIFAYVGILIFTAGLSFAALRGYTPAFYVHGSGPSLLREVVLMAATIFFGVSCLLIVVFDRDRRSFFLSCYAVALALITIGLVALMTSKRANSPLSWLGRSAQFTAGIYFLAAVVAAVRAAWANRWTVPDTIRDFLRPSEALYRDLVETATDAIIPISTSGEILLWNTAAEQMFGYNRMEALRLVPSDLIDPEDSKRMFQEIEAGTVSGKGSYVGKLREVKARRNSGEEFPAELSFSSRRLGGGSVSTLIIRDITERKRAEETLQKRTLELQRLTETLEQRVKERTAELADLSSQLVSAQENERQRISYDLHDNALQALLAIRFEIEDLFAGQDDWAALQEKAKEVMATALDTVGKIRSMQGDLWPYVLDDIGILASIGWYCREFEKNHPGLTIERKDDVTEHEISSSAKIVIYRILQETLSNVAKHSQASRVTLRLLKKDHRVEFTVEDNGIGFDPVETMIKKTPWGGLGLLNIKARTELSGGTFGVESVRGKGTTVHASWPL